jgi:Na+-driven multidrug efflux pump
MIPFGANVAASVCVGNAMGEGNKDKAIIYSKFIALYTLILCTGVGLLMILLKK